MDAPGDTHSRNKGERHKRAKITEVDALAILADRRALREIAKHYGISTSSVNAIKIGLTWRHLDRTEVYRNPRGGNWRGRVVG